MFMWNSWLSRNIFQELYSQKVLCPFHTTGGMFCSYRCYSAADPPLRLPHFIRVVHATGTVICGYRHLTKQLCPSIAVLDSIVTLCHSGETLSPLTLCYTESRLNHNLMYIVDYNFCYCSKKFMYACKKSSAHAHSTELKGENFKHFKTSIGHTR